MPALKYSHNTNMKALILFFTLKVGCWYKKYSLNIEKELDTIQTNKASFDWIKHVSTISLIARGKLVGCTPVVDLDATPYLI